MGDPRENPRISGIVQHDSHVRKSGVTRPEMKPSSPRLEASEYGAAQERKGGKRDIPEKTRRPTASSGMIPTCENPVTRPGIELGSPLWEEYCLLHARTPVTHVANGFTRQQQVANQRLLTHFPVATQPIGNEPFVLLSSGGVVVRLLVSHPGEPGSNYSGVAPGFSHVGIVSDDAADTNTTDMAVEENIDSSLQCCRQKQQTLPYSRLTSAALRARHSIGVHCISRQREAAVAERLARSPSTKANRVQSPAGPTPYFRTWESRRTMPLVSGFSWGSPASSILTSVTLIGSQDLFGVQISSLTRRQLT
ncbi:hypothetical protein PR048_030926 [Dryococelus australis]|uniref:Uncharacterized protein n=1 Tax=Dryococelus australis TaxID=614101 RepID=A0ABQ9GCV0_9NEOP|nr:hypothetical protein PR048_030926 [Dryococelus australis]